MSRDSAPIPGVALTRRTLLEVAGLLSVLADVPGTSAEVAQATAGSRDRRATTPADVAAAERTATLEGELGRHARAVALDGQVAVVGVPPAAETAGPGEGRAVVLVRTGGTWARRATLGADGDSGQFGRAVALDGDTAVIGGELGPDPTGVHAGSVAVFARSGGAWQREATLRGARDDGVDLFGRAVAVADDTLLVGASGAATDEGDGSGVAVAFTRTGTTWRRAARLSPSVSGAEAFGRTIALDGDTAVVGARPAGGGGVAFVFERERGTWRERAALTPPDRSDADRFGEALAIDGGIVVVGAPAESNERGMHAGAASVFVRRNGEWRRQAVLRDENGGTARRFGAAVSVDGDVALVGTRGGGGPVAFSRDGDSWTRTAALRGTGGGPPATGVALDRGRVFLRRGGGPSRSGGSAGRVEVFEP